MVIENTSIKKRYNNIKKEKSQQPKQKNHGRNKPNKLIA